jgi:hypothetical protein
MPLEKHQNDNATEARPSLWVFQGKSVVALVGGVAAFIFLFQILAAWGMPFFLNAALSASPMGLATAFVVFLVNGRAPSYALDLLFWKVFCLGSGLYRSGFLDRPPQFWKRGKKPPRLEEFNRKEQV